MADQAQRSQVVEVAFASSFFDGKDMVGVPEGLARKFFESPTFQELELRDTASFFEVRECSARVDAAGFANASIAGVDLVAKITRVGAELPLVDAEIGAKRDAPPDHFEVAPSAQRSAVHAFLECFPISETAGHGSGGRQT